MTQSSQSRLNRPVTLAGVCLVAVVLAALAGLSLAGYHLVSKRVWDYKVRALLPRICRAATEQRDRLTAASSSYNQTYGFYPPDHVSTPNPIVVETITNQLYYELMGCAYDRTMQFYLPSGSSVRLPQALVREFFGRDIINSADAPKQPNNFLLSSRTEPLVEIHNRPESIALLSYCPNWEGFDGDMTGFQIGTWEYNSSAPQHNPGTYDLWLEIKTAETNIVIGNW